ncbi:MAG: fatty acid desaturase [Rickettsiales bacterium]|nr:fatty acid desaturase [Rickettsiales bacterium]
MEDALSPQAYWEKIVDPYKQSSTQKGLLQLFYTLVVFSAICYAMHLTAENYYIVTLGLSVIAGTLLVKIFVLQHDCGHGSFFKNQKANNILGRMLSVLTITPYAQWAKEHKRHHATCGNLDNRGVGDVTTWTVAEYESQSEVNKFFYRIYRNPFFLFTLGAFYHFTIKQRFVFYRSKRLSSWISVMSTNLFIVLFIVSFVALMGAAPFFKLYLPIIFVASSLGTWMFYVQHQFEDVYWERNDGEWDYYDAAIKGSLFYDLPKILHWLTGNIGYHHIHHLSAKVPNYNLVKCYNETPALQDANSLTLWESRKCFSLALWDETRKKMVTF